MTDSYYIVTVNIFISEWRAARFERRQLDGMETKSRR